MQSSKIENIDDIVHKAWVDLQCSDLSDHVIKFKEEDFKSIMKDSASAEFLMSEKIRPFIDKDDCSDMEKEMSKHIQQDKIDQMKTCSFLESSEMEQSSMDCQTSEPDGIDLVMETGGLVIDVIMLGLNAIGIRARLNPKIINSSLQIIKPTLQSTAFRRALTTFIEAWMRGGKWNQARAIFQFLKESLALGIFWKVVKTVMSEMGWLDYTKAIAETTAMIVLSFATDGVALIARIVIALGNAMNIATRINKIRHLLE